MPQPISEGQITAHIPTASIVKSHLQAKPIDIMVTRKGNHEGEKVSVTVLSTHAVNGSPDKGVPILHFQGRTTDGDWFDARYDRNIDQSNTTGQHGPIAFYESRPPAPQYA